MDHLNELADAICLEGSTINTHAKRHSMDAIQDSKENGYLTNCDSWGSPSEGCSNDCAGS